MTPYIEYKTPQCGPALVRTPTPPPRRALLKKSAQRQPVDALLPEVDAQPEDLLDLGRA